MKKIISTCLLLGFIVTPVFSNDLFDQLKNVLPQIKPNKNPIAPSQITNSKTDTSNSTNSSDQICKAVFGKPFKERKIGSPDELIKRYFKISPDFDKNLYQGINNQFSGTLISLPNHIEDLKEKNIKNLASSFVANPSTAILAQIIEYAEKGDGFIPPRVPEPSEKGDAQVLLAMVMMQYPQLSNNKEQVMTALKLGEKGGSALGTVFISRAYLYGDYARHDMNMFVATLGAGGRKYPTSLENNSIYYALEKVPPNWKQREDFIQQLQMVQEIQDSFKKQQAASDTQNNPINQKALKLMEEGDAIDQLTLDALGAGPKMAEIRAKGEMLRKEGTGEADVIKIKVFQSEAAANLVSDLLRANPKLDGEAKLKFQKANQIRLDNVAKSYNLTAELALYFFNGNIGQVLNTGPLIKQYHRNSCNVLYRQIEIAKMTGVPTEMKSNIEMQKEL